MYDTISITCVTCYFFCFHFICVSLKVKEGMNIMKKQGKKLLCIGLLMLAVFIVFTMAVKAIDVQAIGVNGSAVGFATLNNWFHKLTGVDFILYHITDWLGLAPIGVCILFGFKGLVQLIQRKSVFKVDRDIIFLGVYYFMVISCYVVFEAFPINYRPVLVNGVLEASYPSSTTLLVITIMPALAFYCIRKCNRQAGKIVAVFANTFTLAVIFARVLSGVHWLTDIIGAMLLGSGLFYIYKGVVLLYDN